MTRKEFEEWENEVHCDLFHITPDILDDEFKVRLDQLVVLRMITDNPQALQHVTLKGLLEKFDVLN